MNPFATFLTIWCLPLVFCFPSDLQSQDKTSGDSIEKLSEIVSVLRVAWGQDFESNYRKYMLGPRPTVVLIPRAEMIQIAAARLDGRARDGATTQGLTMGEQPDVRIFVVYDDVAPFLVAKAINHEIGHFRYRDKGLPRNKEEARIRKTVDVAFLEAFFGRDWLKTTVAALQKKVAKVKRNGRTYRGYTPAALEAFYQQMRKSGVTVEKNPLHDGIIATLVFILTNNEENLLAALEDCD